MSALIYALSLLILFCPLGGDRWGRAGDQSDPEIAFVRPDAAATIERPLTYGSIQVRASDPDVGEQDGDGIDRVEMIVVDTSTGAVVAARSEYWSTYDFGPDLPDGEYEFIATAQSSWWAGGTSATISMFVTIDTSPAPPKSTATTVPPTTVPPTTVPPTTVPPTTVPPTTAAPVTTAPSTTAPPSTTAAPSTTAPPTTAPPTTAPPTTGSSGDVERANARSLQLLNELRSDLGLGSLAADPTMATFAMDWSAEMARSGFRHSSGPYAENIVWHSDTSMTPEQAAEQFHQMWVNSPGHYANMTNGRWTLVGVGLHLDESGWWGTHVFR